jgi:hypothetical protein
MRAEIDGLLNDTSKVVSDHDNDVDDVEAKE